MHLTPYVGTLCMWASLALANILGPRYPAPQDITSQNSLVAAAWRNLSDTFSTHINGSVPSALLTGVQNLTFSIGAFSIHDASAHDLQYHYTSSEVANASVGINRVDGNSIYRVASVTKLFTVYAGMIELTEEQWSRPLSRIFPSLATHMTQQSENREQAYVAQWDKITPLALASQLSGAAANAMPFLPNDLLIQYAVALALNDTTADNPIILGLPPADVSGLFSNPACPAPNSSCTAEGYLEGARAVPPTFPPWSSPGYSNNGFILLGLALSALTGRPLDNLYNETIFRPLKMESTLISNLDEVVNRSVVIGGDVASWVLDQGLSKSSGGILSTINDLAKFSAGILNSTLLPTEVTRKWMKPMTHTASLHYSVGAPWEILRYTHPAGTASAGVVTDLYTKLGDSGTYGGVAVLIPEYGAGFNMICGSVLPARSSLQQLVLDAVVRTLLPALEAQAMAESSTKFAGTYVSLDSSLNSSLTLATNSSVAGLTITAWLSNNTNILERQRSIFGKSGGIKLVPTIKDSGSSQYAFRMLGMTNQTAAQSAMAVGPFTGQYGANIDWLTVSAQSYGGTPLDLAVFNVDSAGMAMSVTIPAFNVTLERKK